MSKFKTRQGVVIDDLKSYVSAWLTDKTKPQIWVGCDSQVHGKLIVYAVTVCLYEQGKGAHVISKKIHVNRTSPSRGKQALKDGTNDSRLWAEVEYSIAAADELKDLGVKTVIHVDYNSNPDEESNKLHDSGLGMALSSGYEAAGKPFAFAATYAADKEAR